MAADLFFDIRPNDQSKVRLHLLGNWSSVERSLQSVGEFVSDPIIWVLSVLFICVIIWFIMEQRFDNSLRKRLRNDYYLQRFMSRSEITFSPPPKEDEKVILTGQQGQDVNTTHNNNSVDSRQLTLSYFCLTFKKFTLNKCRQIKEKYKQTLSFCAKFMEKYKKLNLVIIWLIINTMCFIVAVIWFLLVVLLIRSIYF